MSTQEDKLWIVKKIWTEHKITIRSSKYTVQELENILEEGRRIKRDIKRVKGGKEK